MNRRASWIILCFAFGGAIFAFGVFMGQERAVSASPARTLVSTINTHPPPSQEERDRAKMMDNQLVKVESTDAKEYQRERTTMLLQAQMRLGEWGYGTRFSAEQDLDTVSAIRLYQQRNGLPVTGNLDGLTVVRMDADEKAVAIYPFELPPLYFPENWGDEVFEAEGVFRDTSSRTVSGPIHIECRKEWRLCFEEESTMLTPNVAKMTIKEWTGDRIVAEEVAACYSGQLRIERGSKTVVHTNVKTHNDGPCKSFEKLIKTPLSGIYSEELVDGVNAQVERSRTRSAAIRRIKLFSNSAETLMNPGSTTPAGKN